MDFPLNEQFQFEFDFSPLSIENLLRMLSVKLQLLTNK